LSPIAFHLSNISLARESAGSGSGLGVCAWMQVVVPNHSKKTAGNRTELCFMAISP
jgi:hypothetical protein